MSHYITAILSIIAIVLAIAVNVVQYPVVWQMLEGKMPTPNPTTPTQESQEPSVPTLGHPVIPTTSEDTSLPVSSSSATSTPSVVEAAVPPVKTNHSAVPIPFEFFEKSTRSSVAVDTSSAAALQHNQTGEHYTNPYRNEMKELVVENE